MSETLSTPRTAYPSAARRLGAAGAAAGAALLALLLATDLAFIALAFAYHFGAASDWSLTLGAERGYAEVFQYVKEFWIALCFAALAWRHRAPVYAVLGSAFAYVVVDDANEVHERVGVRLAEALGLRPALGLRAEDFGEVLVFGLVGAALLGVGLVAYRSSGAGARRVARLTGAAVVALAAFGVGMDLVHQFFQRTRLAFYLEVVEDGGELLVMSVIAAGAFALLCREVRACGRRPRAR